jgi:hypothetical protein
MMDNPIVYPPAQTAAHWSRFRLLPTGVEVVGDPSFDEWQQAFGDLARAQGSIQWWLGDMLAVGEARYGERYAQAIEATGYAVQTLMNMVFVASHVAPERRRQSLSFTHHKEVASLEPDEQEALLSEAEKREWRSRDMAEAVRTYKRELNPPTDTRTNNLPARVDSAAPNNLPAREDSEPSATAAPTLALVRDEPDPDRAPLSELVAELEHADAENRRLEALVASLQTSEKDKEIARWVLKYNQLEGRLRQEITTSNEAKKEAKRRGDLLRKIRGVLGVERDGEIVPLLMERAA